MSDVEWDYANLYENMKDFVDRVDDMLASEGTAKKQIETIIKASLPAYKQRFGL